MMSENSTFLIERLNAVRLLPVFNHAHVDVWQHIIDVAYRCGIKVLEFSHLRDSRGKHLFRHLIEYAAQYPGLTLGVGTVLDIKTTENYLNAGARFVASPFLRKDMAEVCHANNIPWIPGCSNRDEIDYARNLGASIISILPGDNTRPQTINTLIHEYPDVNFIPSGGIAINEVNLAQWACTRVLCIRMGLSVFSKGAVAIKDWQKIQQNLSAALATIKYGTIGRANSTLNFIQ